MGAAIQQGSPGRGDPRCARRTRCEQRQRRPTRKPGRGQADVVDAHPDFARTQVKALLASARALGQKVVDQARTLKPRPGRRSQGSAEADSADEGRRRCDDRARPGQGRRPEEQGHAEPDRRPRQPLRLDKDKLQSETQAKVLELQDKLGTLPEFVAKDVSSAATDSIAAQQSAARMTDLAARIDALDKSGDLSSGVTAKAREAIKRVSGNQNEITRLRSEYSRIVTPAAMAAYKTVASGSTSDKDIETAMTGVPSDTADPATMASFLRGAAKLQVYDSVLNNAKSEWLQSVKSLGKAKSDITVDGVTVPAGTTFKAFTDAYVQKKVAAQVNAAELATRGYMKYATPDAAPAPLTDALGGASGITP
jgi:hypothetical protein